jgi:hypothetical protein
MSGPDPVADVERSLHTGWMPKSRRRKTSVATPDRTRERETVTAYLKRLTWPAVGWATLGFASVGVSRLITGKGFPDALLWWHFPLLVGFSLLIGYLGAAYSDWDRRRRATKRKVR